MRFLCPGHGLTRAALRDLHARETDAYRKTIVLGLPTFTTWPVGVSLPVA